MRLLPGASNLREDMTRLSDWIDRVAQKDRGLAALLRGLVFTRKGEELTLVWHSKFHRDQGKKREGAIRNHLGALAGLPISHFTLHEWAEQDPMLDEALKLGARVREID